MQFQALLTIFPTKTANSWEKFVWDIKLVLNISTNFVTDSFNNRQHLTRWVIVEFKKEEESPYSH